MPNVDNRGCAYLGLLGQELRASIRAGAALASLSLAWGCGGEADVPLDGQGGAAATGGSGGSTSTALAPYPAESVGCFGPLSESPLYGPQCCFDVRCYTPSAGQSCSTDLERGPMTRLLPGGSGSCGCSVESEGLPYVSGPFAPGAAADENPVGTCCYLVGSVGCTGRPLIVNGTLRVAPLVERADWALLS